MVPRDVAHDYLPDQRAPYGLHVLAAEVEARSLDNRLGVLADENSTVKAIGLNRHVWGRLLIQCIRVGKPVF